MAGVRHLGCCPTCGGGGTVPDDGTGCCSFLPEADLDGSIDIDVYSYEEVIGTSWESIYEETKTISGPFVYYPGPVSIAGLSLFGGPGTTQFSGTAGYYIAGPVCLDYYRHVRGMVLGLGMDSFFIDTIARYSIRVYAVLACVTASKPIGFPPDPVYDTPRVRLFLVSNRGQGTISTVYATPPGGNDVDPPATCDDSDPGDLWQWTVSDDPPLDVITGHGGFAMFSTVDEALVYDIEGGGVLRGGDARATCDPLCFVVDGARQFHLTEIDVRGSIGSPAPCAVPDPDSCACRSTIEVRYECPPTCPDDGEEWVVLAVDTVSEDVFTAAVESERDGEGNCLYWRAIVPVCLTPDPITGLAPASREFDLSLQIDGGTPAPLASVTLTNCRRETVTIGTRADRATLTYCVTGCPGPFPGARPTAVLLDEDGETELYSPIVFSETDADGCGAGIIRLPDVAGTYIVRVTLPSRVGYSTTVHEIEVTLPAAGTECGAVIDLGTLAYDVNTDTHVCTCGGPVEKCIEWTYNAGDTALLIWNGSRWAGDELHLGRFQGALFCEGDPTLPMAVAVEVWVDENCEWRAERDGRQCLRFNVPCPPTGTPTVFSRPALAANAAGAAVTTRTVPVAVAAWGPDAPFPGVNFATGDWRYSDGSSDPSACLAPPEMYGGANAINCPPVGGGAPLLGDAVAPAPSPSALIAVAGSSVRVPATAAPRARSAWESYFRLPPAHPQKDVKRATLCPMRRPCGCHTIRCGFWGDVRPASGCLGCKIKDRFLPPPPAR
jgi:hypothetical protein